MESELELYYQPHKERKREAEFVQSLIAKHNIPTEKIFTHTYALPAEYADKSVLTHEVIKYVKNSDLTDKRKQKLLIELAKLPPDVKVWRKGFKISCDVTLVKDGVPEFYEFHEEQHLRLTDSRPKKIYDTNRNIIIVPRFVQRYLRDYWRATFVNSLKIVII